MTPALLLMTLAAATGASDRQTYIVELEQPAAAVEFAHQRDKLHSAKAQLDVSDPSLLNYVADLDRERAAVLRAASAGLRRAATPRFEYRYAYNGFAIELGADEAQTLARTPGVRSVQRETFHSLLTYGSPDFVGATAAWNLPAVGNRGEGMVIGVIDSGTNYTHPAFAASDVDGYQHRNPRGRYYGICAPPRNVPACNNKRIGVYDFTSATGDGADTNGHGSHTSATAVGNTRPHTFPAPQGFSVVTRLSGMAPHANLIAYKTGSEVHAGSAVIMALEQAIVDQVDVISWSLGDSPRDPWAALDGVTEDPSNVAATNAVRAGILFAASAGNGGPMSMFSDITSLPWVVSVGSSSSDRRVGTSLADLTGSAAPPVAQYAGAGLSTAYGPARIVLGAQFGSAECATGSDPDVNATGISNPFSGRVFNGEIVVCDRGFHARAAKVANARNAGAGAVILVNTADQGDTFVTDSFATPTLQLGYADGVSLKAWVSASADSARGRITGYQLLQSASFGPVLSSTSSFGPDLGRIYMLRPSLTAPGVNILSASNQQNGEMQSSGTSMSAPHVAGMLALLRQGRRSESPLTLISALELTADASVRIHPSGRTATPIEQGAGSARIDRALQAGLVLPLTMSDFERENPRHGGDPSNLNTAALYDESCLGGCTFTRRVRAWRAGSYSAAATIEPGAAITVTPAQFALQAGEEQTLTIQVDVSDPRWFERFAFGAVTLTASDSSIPVSRLTVSVRKPLVSAPDKLDYAIDAERGHLDVPMVGRSNDGDLRLRVRGPVAATHATPTLAPGSATVYFIELTGTGEVRAEITDSTATDWDLNVGVDTDGNSDADVEERLCRSISYTNVEECRLTDLPAGHYWVQVQSFESNNASDTGNIYYGAVPYEASNRRGHATGPARLRLDQTFNARLGYDVGGLKQGDRAYGSVELLRGDDGSRFAELPLSLRRTGVGASTAFYLPVGESRRFLLPAASDLNRMVIDVPAGATSLTLDMRGTEGNASLYLAKAPTTDIGPELPAAPAIAAAAISADVVGSNETLTLAAPQLTPGRWYVVARNPGTTEVAVDISARLTGAETSPMAFEVWYNPARDGHGLFFTRAGNSAQMIWYTYDDAGQPVWYLAFPDGLTGTDGSVSSDLYRYVWAGAAAHGTRVGRVTLTRQGARLVFAWEVDGATGSEPMQMLINSACVNGAGGSFDPSGIWFEPARSGYGANLLVRPELDFAVLYLFDAEGRARWLLGQNAGFGSAPFTLYQYSGFCPSCAAVAVSRQPAGTFTRSFDPTPAVGAEQSGRWTIGANFAAPLIGAWSAQNAPTQLLTARKTCVQ